MHVAEGSIRLAHRRRGRLEDAALNDCIVSLAHVISQRSVSKTIPPANVTGKGRPAAGVDWHNNRTVVLPGHEVDGGDHSFHVLKRSGRTDGEALTELVDALVAWGDGLT